MKKLFFLVVLALSLFSCSTEKETAKNNEESFIDELGDIDVTELSSSEREDGDSLNATVKTLTSQNDLSQEETDYLESTVEEIKSAATGGYRKIVISYPSVDAQGNKVQLSGAIYMAKEPDTIENILLYCHQTATGNDDVPSGVALLCLEPAVVSSLSNTVCFASDYLGFNTSKQYTHPYMNSTLCAQNEIDMLKAGLVYLKKKGYAIKTKDTGLETYIFGYSQGGSVALATQKALEADKQLCEDVNLCHTLCGDGPYDLKTTFQKFLDDGKLKIPLVMPYVLVGMYESYPEEFAGIDIYDYLSDKCKKAKLIEYLKSKPSIVAAEVWVSSKIGSSLSDMMSEKALDVNSDIMQTLFKVIEKQNLLDGSWTPTHPITFYHSQKDDVVSYENETEALSLFPSSVCKAYGKEANKGHMLEYISFSKSCIQDKIFY